MKSPTLPRHGDDGPRLYRVRDQTRLVVATRDDDVGILELLAGGIRVQPPDVALVRAEVRVDERCAVVQSLRHVGDRVERLPVDLDELGRVAGLGTRLGDHDGDPVSLVARDVRERIVRADSSCPR